MYVIIRDNLPCVGVFDDLREAWKWGAANVKSDIEWQAVRLDLPADVLEDDAPTVPLVNVA